MWPAAILPFCLKLSCAIGSGTAAGCACVPMIGPIAIGVGVSAAALVACVISALSGRHVSYNVSEYDLDLLSVRFGRHVDNPLSNISPCLPDVPTAKPEYSCGLVPPDVEHLPCGNGLSSELPQLRGCGQIYEPTTRPEMGCGFVLPDVERRQCDNGYIDVPKIEDLVLPSSMLAPQSALVCAQDVATATGKSGTKAKPQEEEHPHGVYEENGGKHHKNSKGEISSAPTNGQEALDNSVAVKGKESRVAVNNGEIIVLEVTSPGVYHEYVVTWDDIVRAGSNGKWRSIQNALTKNRLVKPNGKIIGNGKS